MEPPPIPEMISAFQVLLKPEAEDSPFSTVAGKRDLAL